MNLKTNSVTPTKNYQKPDLKQNPVAPARKGFQPKTSSQAEEKKQGAQAFKVEKPMHCDLMNEWKNGPKTQKAANVTTGDASLKAYQPAPKMMGEGTKKHGYAKKTGNPGNSY